MRKFYGVSAGYHTEVKVCEKEDSNKYILTLLLCILAVYVIVIGLFKLINPGKELMEGFIGLLMGSFMFSIVATLSMIAGSKEKKAVEEAKDFLVKTSAVICAIDEHVKRTRKGVRISHRVYVSYSYNNIHYDHIPLSHYHSSMKEGYRVQVTIDSRDPGRTVSVGGGAILITMAVLFYIPAIVLLLISLLA